MCNLVIVILLAFLFDVRTAVISITAAAVVGRGARHDRLRSTVNTMVLAGLVMRTGELVDDAIIDVKNIVRRSA